MTTKTLTFTPHPDLQLIPEDDRLKWADALDTSIQYMSGMSNAKDTAHCCLAVAEQVLNGATFKDYENLPFPSAMEKAPYVVQQNGKPLALERILAADCNIGGSGSIRLNFMVLNDTYLTHPQIAQLLRGETVTITEEITDGSH